MHSDLQKATDGLHNSLNTLIDQLGVIIKLINKSNSKDREIAEELKAVRKGGGRK